MKSGSAAFAILIAVGVAGLAVAENPEEMRPVKVGELSSTSLRSPHPYLGGDSSLPVVSTVRLVHPGATYMVVHFSRFELAPGDDVIVRDPARGRVHRYEGQGLWDGAQGTFWSMSVPGDTILIEIRSRGEGSAYGFDVDQYEYGFVPLFEESICGVNDKRDVECYRLSHPDYFATARSVARLRHCGGLCTGSLVSCDNHFISNQHCKGTCGITSAEAWFNFQNATCGAGPTGEVIFQAASEVDIDTTLDYWLLQLGGNPVAQFGHLRLEPRPLIQDEAIYIAQHPGGRAKEFGIESDSNAGNICRIDRPNQAGRGPDTDTGYLCDTEGGSSGSPVLTPATHRMIALHHFGGCFNGAIRMENIVPMIGAKLPGCSFCTPLAAPSSFSAASVGPNAIELTWTAVATATSYRITRAVGGCLGAFVEVATATSSPWTDTGVSGGQTYGYRVEAIDNTGCRGTASVCRSATATGPCTLAPNFSGIARASSGLDSSCEIDLAWLPATGSCSANVVYNIYRSETPGTAPSPMTLVGSCLTGTDFTDTTVIGGTRYYYQIRAEDRGGSGLGACGGGAADGNRYERAARATAAVPLTGFFDGGETTSALAVELPWGLSASFPRNGSFSYRIPGDANFTCASLVSPPMIVTSSSVLTYSSRVEQIEVDAGDPSLGWDGGTVELSTDSGVTWVSLSPTPGYPKRFISTSNSCNNADRMMGGVYAGDEPDYVDASIAIGAFFAGQEIQVRFRFATDDASASGAWWIDDIAVSDLAETPCGTGSVPPGEVSGFGSTFPLKLVKGVGGDLKMSFEARPEAIGYNLYEGDIDVYFSHGTTPFRCDPAVTTIAPSQLEATMVPNTGSHYYLVTAWNGDPVNGQEGTTGPGRPAAENTCPPSNNR